MELPTIETIVAMVPGPEMDALVHVLVLGLEKRGRLPKYSTDHTKAAEIIMRLPLAMGQIDPGSNAYTGAKPYWAGNPDSVVVTADTPAKALCKAALIYLVDQAQRVAPQIEPPDEATIR